MSNMASTIKVIALRKCICVCRGTAAYLESGERGYEEHPRACSLFTTGTVARYYCVPTEVCVIHTYHIHNLFPQGSTLQIQGPRGFKGSKGDAVRSSWCCRLLCFHAMTDSSVCGFISVQLYFFPIRKVLKLKRYQRLQVEGAEEEELLE